MTTKQLTCYEIVCDGCGGSVEGEDHIRHFRSAEEGISEACGTHEWVATRDGKIFCYRCESKAPACLCEDSCDADMCLPGCPCERHEEIGPIPPCERCGESGFETRGALSWHLFVHKRDPEPAQG